MNVILKNVRMPGHTVGDLRAMMAAGDVGRRRYLEMVDEYGAEAIQRHVNELMDRAERLTRQKIAEIPDGTYSFEDWLDNDGIDLETMHKLKATVTIDGSDMFIDFEGTDPQLKGAANSALSGPYCCAYYVMHCLVGPEIPINSGCYRAISLNVPKGTLLNPDHPAPLNARTMTMCRTVDVIFGSLIQAVPERLRAASAGMEGVSLSGRRPGDNSAYVYLELFAGGMGARPTKDGIDYIECDVTNMMNAPVEAVEMEYPIRVHRALLREDTGGAGKFRGGTGIEKEFELTEGECEITHRGDRFFTQPWGLFGGKPGASWATRVTRKDGEAFDVPARLRFPLRTGDRMYCYTGGGGGHGDPLERNPSVVAEDVWDRKVSAQSARNDYGVVIDEKTGDFDPEETERQREQMRTRRGPITWTYDLGGDLGVL
jgi:N-methylhydantoinase B